MLVDWNCGSILNFGLLWQRRECAESPFISYSRISYFGHACSNLNFILISRLLANAQHKNVKTYAILIYERVDILWTY